MGLAKALFTEGSANISCTTVATYPTFWTKQLRVGDFIRPLDTLKDYTVLTIVDDANIVLDSTYSGTTGIKPFAMTSKYPLYDDDGYTGPKITGTKIDGFGIYTNDYLDITIDSSDQTCSFLSNTDSGPFIAQILTAGFNGIRATYEWVVDPVMPYGYKSVLMLRVDGTQNKIIIHSDASGTAEKLGFTPDSTYFGNNDNTSKNPELICLNLEKNDISTDGVRTVALINYSYSNKLNRSSVTGISYATDVYNLCADEIIQIQNQLTSLYIQKEALETIVQEPTLLPYSDASTALANVLTAITDCSNALTVDQSTISAFSVGMSEWALNLQNGQQDGTLVSETVFNIYADESYGRGFVDATVPIPPTSGIYYHPIAYYKDTFLPISGIWNGNWNPSSPYRYTLDGTLSFTIEDSTEWVTLYTTDTTTHYFETDSTSLTIDGTSFLYTLNPTIGSMKLAINDGITGALGVDATGNESFDSSATGFRSYSETLITSFNLHPGLRDCTADYWTLDDKNLGDRTDFLIPRLNQVNSRISYLTIRQAQIMNVFASEEFLRSTDGSTGNIYIWANNRFNRSSGCEAQLKQIEKQIEMNQSSLEVNKRFI